MAVVTVSSAPNADAVILEAQVEALRTEADQLRKLHEAAAQRAAKAEQQAVRVGAQMAGFVAGVAATAERLMPLVQGDDARRLVEQLTRPNNEAIVWGARASFWNEARGRQPVRGWSIVNVSRRNGSFTGGVRADVLDWDHCGKGTDIVSWCYTPGVEQEWHGGHDAGPPGMPPHATVRVRLDDGCEYSGEVCQFYWGTVPQPNVIKSWWAVP